ncbi:autotransporter outer membrane beta-barrel domain-containing protein [Hoeflea sp. WL0058]|uniref:Autotransporter outer membrane beta-barrel domain-containing protein n=1 Tax=Flavimaribacter sediminis TaxID=2865987 RepID=A0AAE3D0L7_9HYPH|nr:autotransporter outer membrane beta-barrel domain-containing protein [Flavimaribacter sediminis]MBW8636891.1 autotransporter outer membrane beta-barrel domain-containing protein [Flavimaribacter sediminis]
MKSRSLASIAAQLLCGASLSVISVSAARADCDPASPTDGQTVICTGPSTGFVDENVEDVTVIVEEGAVVDGGGDRGFRFGDNGTLTNDGTILSGGGEHGVQGGDEASITNNGLIDGDGNGVNVDDDAYVLNSETGEVIGADDGVQIEEDGEIYNEGTVTANDGDALKAADGAYILNEGTATGSDDGIQVENDGEIVNTGTVTAYDGDALKAENGAYIMNEGAAIGYSDGIQVEENGEVYNSGDVTAYDGDGIKAGDGAYIENDGTLTASDDGIQADLYSTAINNGAIYATDEGINLDADGAVVINNGSITALDDGIHTATNSWIENNGSIYIPYNAGDPQDGIDLDDGVVLNTGLIEVENGGADSQDGIDFDEDGAAASYITNTGSIIGYHAVNTDPLNTKSQTIYNYGYLEGFGGVAINLGDGDDALQIGTGSRIVGLVDLGDGTDSFSIDSPVASLVNFVSAPEIVDLNGFAAIVTSTQIATIDPAPFQSGDALMRSFFFDMTDTLYHDRPEAGESGFWLTGFGSAADFGSSTIYSGYDTSGGGGVGGYDHAVNAMWSIGLFGGGASYSASIDDGEHDTDLTSGFGGVRAFYFPNSRFTLNAAILGGVTQTSLSSPDYRTGSGSGDGSFLATTGGFAYEIPAAEMGGYVGLELLGQAGALWNWADSYRVSGFDGATIGARDSAYYFGTLEAGLPFEMQSGGNTIRFKPFAGVTFAGFSDDPFSLTAIGFSTSFTAPNDIDGTFFTGGAELAIDFDGKASLTGRFTAAYNSDSTSYGGTLNLRIPFPVK